MKYNRNLFRCFLSLLFVIASLFHASPRAVAWEEPGAVKLSPSDTEADVERKAASVKPAPRQLAWQRLEFIAFIHFGMNTFTNKEWGDGAETESQFNPADFDARQWVKAVKDAGMKEIIITAKHHDGFCLWPSKFTEHSVKNSPWRGGKGDVVKEVADAARAAGIKFGFYLSPWDRHEKTFGTTAYNDYYMNQLRELLTNYGEVSEVWMDGACGDMDPRCKDLKYDWSKIFALVRELQPNAVMSIYSPDARWIGNEGGEGRATEWSPLADESSGAEPGGIETLMKAAKRGALLKWYPAQADTSIRPGWFYHKGEDFMVKSLKQLVDIYFSSVGGNAQMLLNIPPDQRGRITDYDIKRLKQFRRALDTIFEKNIASGAKVEAESGMSVGDHAPGLADDGNIDTYWAAPEKDSSAALVFDLGAEKTFDVAMLMENIANGQHVAAFFLDAQDADGNWKQFAGATTIGHKKLLRFSPVKTRRVRLRITKSRAAPEISEFGLFDSKGAAFGGVPNKAEEVKTVEAPALNDTLPKLPPGKKFELVWHDEFNGDKLDTSTWNYTNGPRRDAFWSEDAVKLDGKGNLVIYAMKDGDKYIDGVIDTQRKFEHSFGYYTARVQLQKQPGHWSAFWLMGDKVGRKGDKGRDGTEIDIYEKIDQTDEVLHNLHWDSYCDIFCEAGAKRQVPGVMDGFHTFSVWWKPDEYVFYVDGKETWRTTAGGVCQEPLYVMFSDEIGKWAGDIKNAVLPDYFLVDYVRVYDVVDAKK